MTRLLPLLLVLAAACPALAGDGKKDEVGALLFGPWLLGLVAFPVGLALHCLILAHAPRRGAGLVHKVETYRGRTIALGLLNTLFLGLVFIATAQAVPALGLLVGCLWWTLALVGSHGIARSIGARVLDEPTDGKHEVRGLAVGWFVMVFASALPGLGWLLATYWSIRATGGVVLAAFSVPDDAVKPLSPTSV